MVSRFYQGKYIPAHPTKFAGDLSNIVFRSSWELRCLQFFDNNPSITKVMSEEIKIPYWNPVKQRMANYFPDFYIEVTGKDGTTKRELIEVKPRTQVVEQRRETTHARLTRAVNYAKWESAIVWCKARDINFRILTEKDIFGAARTK